MRFLVLSASIASIVLAASGTAVAQDDGVLSIPDPCGDASGYVRTTHGTQPIPDAGRAARYDLRATELLQPTDATIRLRLGLCAPIEADGLTGRRGLFAKLPDGCELMIEAVEPPAPGIQRTGRFAKSCPRPATSPLVPAGYEERFAHAFHTVAADGDQLTLELDRTDYTGEAAEALARGTEWKHVRGVAVSTHTVVGFGFANFVSWDYSAPGAVDEARSDRPYVVR